MNNGWQTLVQVGVGVLVIGLVLAGLMFALIWRSLRRIKVAPDADFFTTLRAVPIGLVIGLDLLDLSLDFLSTPIDWLILSRFNLRALRNVAAVEALIPFTQPIPTLTIAWFAARLLNLGDPPSAQNRAVLDTEEIRPGEYIHRTGRR